MKKLAALAAPALLGAALAGCRSTYTQTTIDNTGDRPIRLVEVDYPSASYGTEIIAAHASFPYRFKVQGSGPVTISFTDPANKMWKATGPVLTEGKPGSLRVTIDGTDAVHWQFTPAAH